MPGEQTDPNHQPNFRPAFDVGDQSKHASAIIDKVPLDPVDAWMETIDGRLDKGENQVTLKIPLVRGLEQAKIIDGVNKLIVDDQGNKIGVPTAVVEMSDGTRTEIPVVNLLQWRQLDEQPRSDSAEAQGNDHVDALIDTAIEHATKNIGGESFVNYMAPKMKENADKAIAEHGQVAAKDLQEIILNNSLDGHQIVTPLGTGETERTILQKKGALISIYAQDAQTAEAIAEHNIAGFHGTRSGALLGVLEHGALLSAAEAGQRGRLVVTGERTFSKEGGQGTMSFADWSEPESISMYTGQENPQTLQDLYAQRQDLQRVFAENHRTLGADHPFTRNLLAVIDSLDQKTTFIEDNPDNIEAQLMLANFPIAFGLDMSGFKIEETFVDAHREGSTNNTVVARTGSDIDGEFQVIDKEIPLERLPVVAVPKSRVAEVQALFDAHQRHVKVIDLAHITQRLTPTQS